MKWTVCACAVAAFVALGAHSAAAQGNSDNPFTGHSDTGETVHILPTPAAVRSPHDTQPSDAPVKDRADVYAASYGSGKLVDHGGPVIPLAYFYAIYYNSAVAYSAGSQNQATLKDQVFNFVNDGFSRPNSPAYDKDDTDAHYSIVSQYKSISPTLLWAGDFVDEQVAGGSLSDSKVRSYLASLFTSGTIAADNQTIYGIYFPSGMKITLTGGASCSSFCGYHGHFNYNGTDVKYAVFPYTDCLGCSLPGKEVADMLTIVTSHEIREAATDPDLNAWYDAAGYEADDKCAWHNLYQTNRGSFWVQPEYSNGGTVNGVVYPGPGCVVPPQGSGSTKTATTSTVSSSSASSVWGDLVTFTAAIEPAPGASGTVTFYDDGTTLGTGTTIDGSGQSTFSTSGLSGGVHTITAIYGGNSNYSGSTSGPITQTITDAPTTTVVVSSLNPSVDGDTVTFTATVTAGATGTVTFSDGGVVLSAVTLNNGQAQVSTGSLSVGPHTITADYSGDTYFNPSSGSVNQQVNSAPVGSFSLSAPGSPFVVAQNSSVSLDITVAPDGGFTGDVVLSASGTPPQSSVTFVPDVVPVSGSASQVSKVTITIGRRTPKKNYTITIMGTSGSLAATTTIDVTVQ